MASCTSGASTISTGITGKSSGWIPRRRSRDDDSDIVRGSMKALRVLAFAGLIATTPSRCGGADQAGGAEQAKACAAEDGSQARTTRTGQAGAAPPQLGITTPSGLTYVITARAERPAAEDRRDGAGALHRHADRRHQVRQLAGSQGADRLSARSRRGHQGLGRGDRADGNGRQRGADHPAAIGLRRRGRRRRDPAGRHPGVRGHAGGHQRRSAVRAAAEDDRGTRHRSGGRRVPAA